MTTQEGTVFFVRAVTPVHVGVDVGLGAINLPTMREAITQHPIIPGTSFKGVMRDLEGLSPADEGNATDEPSRKRWAAFGPSRARASDYRGGLVFSDARLLLLPVPSLKGTFAWATSRFVLKRFNDGLNDVALPPLPLPDKNDVCVAEGSRLRLGDGRASLREVLVEAREDGKTGELAKKLSAHLWPEGGGEAFFRERFAVLPDEIFDAFARSGLEVRARVAIDSESGTAERSGPWTEEHVPAETVLAGLAFGRQTVHRRADGAGVNPAPFTPHDMLSVFTQAVGQGRTLRIGGHSSVGLGRVRLTCAGRP
jgi:CRISPR-associated protein Cmr4